MRNLPSIIIASVVGVVFVLIIGPAFQETETEVQVSSITSDFASANNSDQNDDASDQDENMKIGGNDEQFESDTFVYDNEDTDSHVLITKYTSQNTNLMSEADSNSYIINTIPSGTPVELYEDCDCDWICVAYKNNYGYVYGKSLSDSLGDIVQTNRNNYDVNIDKTSSTDTGTQTNASSKSNDLSSIEIQQEKIPDGATALCRDGTYSFSRHRRGTCSWHGGVAKWF